MTSDPFQSPNVSDYSEVIYSEMLGGNKHGINFRFGNKVIPLTEPCWRFSFYDVKDKYKLTILVRNFLVKRHNLPLYKRPRIRSPVTKYRGSDTRNTIF